MVIHNINTFFCIRKDYFWVLPCFHQMFEDHSLDILLLDRKLYRGSSPAYVQVVLKPWLCSVEGLIEAVVDSEAGIGT
jgi:hypothetical protein